MFCLVDMMLRKTPSADSGDRRSFFRRIEWPTGSNAFFKSRKIAPITWVLLTTEIQITQSLTRPVWHEW